MKALPRSLRPVFRAASVAAVYSGGVQRSPHDVVPNTRKILYSPPANQNHRVLLKRVAHTGNVRVDFVPVGQAHTSNLSKRRVRLLRSRRKNAQANTTPLGAFLQVRRTGSRLLGLPALADQLLDCRHATSALLTYPPISGGVHDRFLVRFPAGSPHDPIPGRATRQRCSSCLTGTSPVPCSPFFGAYLRGCFPSFKDKSGPVPASRTRRERRRGVLLPSYLQACGDSRSPTGPCLSLPLRIPEAERGDAVSCSEAAAS